MSDSLSLRSRLESDLKSAMRSGDKLGRDTIRFVLAALKNTEIEKGGPLNGDEDIALLQRQGKRMQDAIEQFRKGDRSDLVEREAAQLAIVKRYLPAELSDQELTELVRWVANEVGAAGPDDLRKLMPALIAKAEGRADGRRLSAAAKAVLSEP